MHTVSMESSRASSLSDVDFEEEYSRWRESLVEQVEQELEEQVRLRLRLSGRGRRTARPRSTVSQRRLQRVRSSRSRALPKYNQPTSSLSVRAQESVASSCSVEDQCRDSDRVLSLSEETLNVASSSCRRGESPTQPVASCVLPSTTGDPPGDGSAHTRENSGLERYMHSKYNTPIEHLQNLSATGTFKAVSFDTSSCGRGPIIHCPPEAHLSLPTPTHITPTTPALFPISTNDQDLQLLTSEAEVTNGRREGASCDEAETSEAELKFASSFEGGNLHRAIKSGRGEYQLLLRSDLYCKRHTQWYYFQVEGMQANVLYHFHIINFRKPDSLYNYGMQPLLYSEREAELGWRRAGWNITYHPTPKALSRTLCNSDADFFSLSWTMEFASSGDRCYLAHCYPYPFSKLLLYVEMLQPSPHVQCTELCKTLAGNSCPLLTITDFKDVSVISSRPVIVVSARVHPGESNSSWMMEGFIEWLTSEAVHAEVLRNNFVFKLIPMLNPDGVVVGNSRTSLAGVDLNRVYKKPRQDLFPTIFSTKAMLTQLKQEKEVLLYVDLHGHSRKQNVFTYGCHTPNCDHNQFLIERVFPFLLSRQLPGVFSFRSCKYSVHHCKESTGRVVTWRMGVSDAFTLESTFCGCSLGQSSLQFTEQDLKDVGRGLGEAIYRRHRMMTSKSYNQRILCELAQSLMSEVEVTGAGGEPLPDLVRCTRPPESEAMVKSHKTRANAKKVTKRAAAKTMKEFLRCNLSQLGEESSTTGSDSENDEFEYQERKKVRKRRGGKQQRASTQSSITLPSLVQPGRSKASLTHHSQQRRERKVESKEEIPLKKQALRSSAPARLSGGCSESAIGTGGQSSGWKFVNKYAHRSNGGIPMFSDERLRQRAEKTQASRCMPTTATQDKDVSRREVHLLWEPSNSKVQESQSPQVLTKQLLRSTNHQTKRELDPLDIRWHSSDTKKRPDVQKRRLCGEQNLRSRYREQKSLDVFYQQRTRLQLPTSLAKYISDMWKGSDFSLGNNKT